MIAKGKLYLFHVAAILAIPYYPMLICARLCTRK